MANTETAVAQPSKQESMVDQQTGLIATAFGNLTKPEIREWERMLGRKLFRLPQTT